MKPILVVMTLLLGCESGPPTPVDPVWGKQACGHCAMLVSEKPPSAQALLTDGTRVFFDDVGCLASWLGREQVETRKLWVRSPAGTDWVDATTARYSSNNPTPMDFGFIAAESGIPWSEVRARVAARSAAREGERK